MGGSLYMFRRSFSPRQSSRKTAGIAPLQPESNLMSTSSIVHTPMVLGRCRYQICALDMAAPDLNKIHLRARRLIPSRSSHDPLLI